MNGEIVFANAEELAKFLKEFTGSSATFKVTYDGSEYVLTFDGGY